MNEQNVMVAIKGNEHTTRAVRVEYTESLGDAYKSVSFETLATLDELRKLIRDLIGGDGE